MQDIQLIFDPGKGGRVSLSRMTAIVGDRVGAMPRPSRSGYVFAGWYMSPTGDPEATDAIPVTGETVLEGAMLGEGATEVTLYARWQKESGKKAKKKTSLKTQRRAIVALAISVVVLVAAFVAVQFIVDIYEYADFDGVTYTIKKKDGVYGLYRDGVICDRNDDGYYLTDLGTQLELDPKTGAYEIYAVVDTQGTEEVGVNQRVLMFKQLTYDAASTKDLSKVIKTIEIHNQNGSFVLNRGEANRFTVKDHPAAMLEETVFAQLSVGCGYTISQLRLSDPVRLPDGSIDYSEYGLIPEKRQKIDDEGKPVTDDQGDPVLYDYTPSWYTITTMTGDTYTVTLGDATVTGGGYYARYEDRATVYVLSSTNLDEAVLQPIESLVTPMMIYPMTTNTYFQVSNFIYRSDIDHDRIQRDVVLELTGFDLDTVTPDENGVYPPEAVEKLKEATKLLDEMDEESFSKLYDRVYEAHSRVVTAFSYIPMEERENTLYSALPYRMSSEYMAGYLPNSDNIGKVLQTLHAMSFDGVAVLGPTDEELEAYGLSNPAHEITFIYKDAEGQEFGNAVSISEKTEDGVYYAYSEIFDMIVIIPESQAEYLEWEDIDWYQREYFQANIGFTQTIKVEAAGLPEALTFTLDNSMSDLSNGINSDKMVIYANGERVDYKVTVTKPSGSQAEEDATYNFRRFYQALLTASVEGMADLTSEEMEALRATPDEKCLLKLTILCDDGQGTTQYHVYRFYRYTERKAYMTVEVLGSPEATGDPTRGQGSFYVLSSFCDKLIADAGRFMRGEEITVDSKN